MQIKDYETGRELRDVGISLTAEEASDMLVFLQRLVRDPGLVHIHLSEVSRSRIEREITFALKGNSTRALTPFRVA